MSFFALICALLLDKYRPLPWRESFDAWLNRLARRLVDSFSTDKKRHGLLLWLLVVLPLVAITTVFYWLLHYLHPLFALLLNVLFLYHTLHLQIFSEQIEQIKQSLNNQQNEQTQKILATWRGYPEAPFDQQDLARIACEYLLIASHRQMFGVVTWFILFSLIGLGGAAGALLYRLTHKIYQQWLELPYAQTKELAHNETDQLELTFNAAAQREFVSFAQRAYLTIDWLPTRISALTFAIVGNFEQTLRCWRNQSYSWSDKGTAVLLSSGAGAAGIKLGQNIHQNGKTIQRPLLGAGDDVDEDSLSHLWGLILRASSFLLILLLMMTLANLLG